jgi:phosphate transport system ATP-binding protein
MSDKPKIKVQDLRLSFGSNEVLRGISFEVFPHEIFGIIGPSQSGKTSLLRCLNRTIEFSADARVTGTISVDGQDVRHVEDLYALRRKIGMVAPLPVGLPMSIYENVAYAPRCSGISRKAELDKRVERCLRQAALWDEVKDRLHSLGTRLSGGQQQRLTFALTSSPSPSIRSLQCVSKRFSKNCARKSPSSWSQIWCSRPGAWRIARRFS